MNGQLCSKIEKLQAFQGPLVANAVPFKDDGTINLEAVEPYARYLSSIGVRGVYVHGTTGEGLSLTNREKTELTHKWWSVLRSGHPDMLGIFNVSSTCLPESLEQARFCESIGVDAIAVLPPVYYRPANVDQLVAYLKLIADAAPNTPLIYYHFPEMSHVHVDLPEFVCKGKRAIPSFCGMKYTCKDMVDMSKLTPQHRKNFKIFAAYEASLTPMMAMGINAAVCALFNFAEPVQIFIHMLEKFPHDMAAVSSCQNQMNTFAAQFTKEGVFITNIKKRLMVENKGAFHIGKPRPPIF